MASEAPRRAGADTNVEGSAAEVGLLELLRGLAAHIDVRRRRHLLWTVVLIAVGGLAELCTVSGIVPFFALMSAPERVLQHPQLRELLAALGWDSPRQLLLPATLLFVIALCASTAIRILLTWVTTVLSFELGSDFYSKVYRRMLDRPYLYHVSAKSGELIAGVNKAGIVVFSVIFPLLQMLTAFIIGGFILIGLLLVDATTALAAGSVLVLSYASISHVVRRRLQRNGKAIALAEGRRICSIQEGLGGIRDVLLDRTQDIFLERFRSEDLQLRRARESNHFLSVAPRYLVEGIGMVAAAVTVFLMAGSSAGLVDGLPVLAALALGAQRLLPMAQQAYQSISQVQGSRAILQDVLALLGGEPPNPARLRYRVEPMEFRDKLALHNVRFTYPGAAQPALAGISLQIPPGARVGFIGHSGSGKSTLADLIMGLLPPESGLISVDGIPLAEHNIGHWQRRLAHVPQAIFLADGSIWENIAFGVPPDQIDYQAVVDAAAAARLDEFVSRLPEGFDTQVGERGGHLSGGQRQRIGLARALYKGADVLVLDEATSALDADTEESVMTGIAGLGPGITVILIAHRLSTLRGCDLICRLERGRIVQVGSFDEVVGQTATIIPYQTSVQPGHAGTADTTSE